ncbi:MAG: aminodeoxychorismate synthase component I [Desulfuromonadaceae bacterium]|nr:aminodeoxychorismate synthase component I [Desulfuromonadaceae bacterium]
MAMNECPPNAPVWLQLGDSGEWWRFEQPQQLLSCTCHDEVRPVLRQVDEWVRRGLYAVGFVCYEAAAAFDPAMPRVRDEALPLAWFAGYERPQPALLPQCSAAFPQLCWRADVTPEAYRNAIERIKQAIASGDSYQINYTYRLCAEGEIDPWTLFLYLQCRQQGRYGAYIDLGEQVICSASPELFFAVDPPIIRARPMKGTAPRGRDEREDERQRRQLLSSSKNRAENLMIVDMLRNDIGRIAETGSVRVEELCRVERYPTLWQLTTPLSARLLPGAGLEQQFAALFPCASITGAPKVRTMELIRELETSPRGIYTGAIGLVTPQGRSQFSVAIRTALVDRRHKRVSYGVGGGIVWDSQAGDEYRETRIKARVLPGIEPFRLLETLLWRPDSGFQRLDGHLDRLQRSAAFFGYPFERYALRQQLIDTASRRSPGWYRVRCLLASCGELEVQFYPYAPAISTQPLVLKRLHGAVRHDDPLLRHKTDDRQRYQQWHEAVAPADDALLINERGEVTESTMANVVAYLGGRWVTPALECGLLPGVLRRELLEAGRIVEGVIRSEQLTAQTPLYLINSLRGWRWARLQDEAPAAL